MVLSLLGTCGAQHGVADLSEIDRSADVDEAEDAQVKVRMELSNTLLTDPRRRPLGAANVLVSLMLVVAAFMLSARHRTALWWLRNAMAANVLVIIASVASHVATLYANENALLPVLASALDPPDLEAAPGALFVAAAGVILTACINMSFHLYVAWRAHRFFPGPRTAE